MLSALIIILLFLAFYVGYRRGIVRNLFYFAGYAATVFVALLLGPRLGNHFTLWIPFPAPNLNTQLTFYSQDWLLKLEEPFYHLCGFLCICLLGWLLTHFIAHLLFAKCKLPTGALSQVNHILGGLLQVVVVYIFCLVGLLLLSVLPVPSIQAALENSMVVQWMWYQTPMIIPWLQNFILGM